MEKFTSLKWLLNGLTSSNRFVYFDAAPRGGEVEGEQEPPTPEEAHDANLDELQKAEGPLEMAAALEHALDSLEQQYEGQAQDRIEQGGTELQDMLAHMGIEGDDAAAILEDYSSVFTDGWGSLQDSLETANNEQKTEIRERVNERVKRTLASQHEQQDLVAQEAVDNADAQVDAWDGVIDSKNDELSNINDQIDTAEDSLTAVAKEYGIDPTAISTMDDQVLYTKVYAHMAQADPNWEIDTPEGSKRAEQCRRRIAAFIQPAIDNVSSLQAQKAAKEAEIVSATENRDAWKVAHTEAKQHQKDVDKMQEEDLESVENGTYQLENGETINERVERVAEKVSDKEAEIYQTYAARAQERASELVRAIVYKQLETRIKEIEDYIDGKGGLVAQIEQREGELQHDVDTQKRELDTQMKDFQLDTGLMFASTGEAGTKRAIEDGIRKQYSEAKLLDKSVDYGVQTADEAVAIMVDRRYEALSGRMDAYHGAQGRQQNDPELVALQEDKSNALQTIALLTAEKDKDIYNS